MGEGLADGSRVAVVGGGLSAVAVAAALGIAGRLRGRSFSVHVHDGDTPRLVRPPVVLSPSCRTHLAALGCRVPPAWSTWKISQVEVLHGRRARSLPPPPAPLLWIPDSTPLRQALAASASLHGALFLGRRVEAVEPAPTGDAVAAQRGKWLVRARGRADRYRAVLLASGASATPAGAAWPAHRPPPRVATLSVRLVGPAPEPECPLRVLLLPAPGLTVLELFPEPTGWYARAWGTSPTPAALGAALAQAHAAGILPEGLEPGRPRLTWVAGGVATALAADGRLAVGDAALGHPLEHGLSTLLHACTGAAHALVEHGPDSPSLTHAFAVESQRAAVLRVNDARRAARALPGAGAEALEAFTVAAHHPVPWLSTAPGCLGLPAPTPAALRSEASRARWRLRARSLFAPALPLLPRPQAPVDAPSVLLVDPDARRVSRLAHALAARGATCTALPDGLTLLRALLASPPNAVVLGGPLPWMDAVALVRLLRSHPEGAALPLLVAGAHDFPEARRQLAALGALSLSPDDAQPETLARLLLPEPLPQVGDAPAVGAS